MSKWSLFTSNFLDNCAISLIIHTCKYREVSLCGSYEWEHKLGDEIETGGASGIVKEIQIFSTIMETNDKKTVIVPNAKITSDKIIIHHE